MSLLPNNLSEHPISGAVFPVLAWICSGLIQLSMAVSGRKVLRDSDGQYNRHTLIKDENTLERDDLVFWKGHAAILVDGKKKYHP